MKSESYNNTLKLIREAALIVIFWMTMSFFGSIIKSGSHCGKSFYMDYIIFNDLFCEIKQ